MIIKQFCYVDTLYSLFVYLLLKKDNTFYFFESNIPKEIREKFQNYYFLSKREKEKIKFLEYLKIYIYYKKIGEIIDDFKCNKIYLQDHLKHSSYFLEKIDECFLLEDGFLNYDEEKLKKYSLISEKLKLKKIFKERILKGITKKYRILGLSDKVKKIYLTGIKEPPNLIKEKVEIINIKERWKNLSIEGQKKILDIFNLKTSDLEKWESLKNKVLLITQPLSEDSAITEKEKIEIYSDIIRFYHYNNIIIKPHPREKTDYKMVFPEIEIITGKFPLEILMLLGINFKEVVTIFSTAALNFKGITNVNFLGTNDYENLKERFGSIEKIYYKI